MTEFQDPPTEEEIRQITAKRGQSYPIRILHLVSDLLVIGFVIEVLPDTVLLLRPYVIDADGNDTEMRSYELIPYLDQLADYDPQSLVPIPFFKTSIIAPVTPARHLIKTYTNIVNLKEQFSVSEELTLRPSFFPKGSTRH